jgi:hypothetical protein
VAPTLNFAVSGVNQVSIDADGNLNTVKFLGNAGESLLPTYSFTGHTSTGMYYYDLASENVTFAVNGADIGYFDATGLHMYAAMQISADLVTTPVVECGTASIESLYVNQPVFTHATTKELIRVATIPVANGGTNIASYTAGDLLYASATTTLTKLPAGATDTALLSGTTPSWGKVGLTTHISGILSVVNGGTGNSTALTNGQLWIGSSASPLAPSRATINGTSDQVTVTNGAGTITLSTPQNIATTSTVRFGKLGLGMAATNVLDVSGDSSISNRLSVGSTSYTSGNGAWALGLLTSLTPAANYHANGTYIAPTIVQNTAGYQASTMLLSAVHTANAACGNSWQLRIYPPTWNGSGSWAYRTGLRIEPGSWHTGLSCEASASFGYADTITTLTSGQVCISSKLSIGTTTMTNALDVVGRITATAGVTCQSGVLAASATSGFLDIPTMSNAAGPTGSFTPPTGCASIVYETVNYRLYIRTPGGQWRYCTTTLL